MSKNKKTPPRQQKPSGRGETSWPPLTDLEEEVSFICLRFFRGDWDLYLDYLTGPRVTDPQRERDLPVVSRLKRRDQQTDYLAAVLEDEVVLSAERFGFEDLYRLWELCLLLDPALDPYGHQVAAGTYPESVPETGSDETPPSLH
ncbi:MAG: hypothetical protein ABIF77_01020 [bacterium]